MKKIAREVKDLNSFVVERKICFAISIVVGFFADYIPFVMGASILIWILCWLMFATETYFVCRILCMMRSSEKRLSKQHISDFLYTSGNNVVLTSKLKIAVIKPFTRTIYYITEVENTQTKAVEKVLFILSIKNNSYSQKSLKKEH